MGIFFSAHKILCGNFLINPIFFIFSDKTIIFIYFDSFYDIYNYHSLIFFF